MTVLRADGSRVVKVAICIPCQDQVNAGFALDLARLVGVIARSAIEFTIIQNRGTIIPQQRATLATLAMQWGATHVLWLDSDMRFPTDTLDRLLTHEEPIVAANYSTRRVPILPTAEHREHGMLFTTPESDGLVEVSHCGMGVMLVDTKVYATVKQPWFALGFNPNDSSYIGEDFFFLRRARESGYVTLIDQDLSKEVRHVGEMEFRAEHACVTRDVHNARQPA
jgi:hypothetical protein